MTKSVFRVVALVAAVSIAALATSQPADAGRRGGAAIAGFAVGAIVGSALARPYYAPPPVYYAPPPPRVYYAPPPRVYYAPPPWTPDWYAYCASKYRSFDPRSGTYQPYYGPRRFCR